MHIDANELKRRVDWQDLRNYQPWETVKELSLPIPWLGLALYSTSQGWYALTLVASFYFFLTGLRVTHNAFHYCLGLSRRSTDYIMFILSLLMLGSMHATQYTHILHHRHCLSEEDVEGSVARQSFWLALLKGPLFPVQIHITALRHSKAAQRQWIKRELAANVIGLIVIWGYLDIPALKVHTLLMVVAYSFSAFFAVWTVHHDCDHSSWDNSRTLRSPWKSYLFYNMFYHTEHHLFPQIPTCHLPQLARRLDQAGYRDVKPVF